RNGCGSHGPDSQNKSADSGEIPPLTPASVGSTRLTGTRRCKQIRREPLRAMPDGVWKSVLSRLVPVSTMGLLTLVLGGWAPPARSASDAATVHDLMQLDISQLT